MWAVQYVDTLVWGLEPRDPATFITAAAILSAVTAFAAALPAWRATRTDPANVLKGGFDRDRLRSAPLRRAVEFAAVELKCAHEIPVITIAASLIALCTRAGGAAWRGAEGRQSRRRAVHGRWHRSQQRAHRHRGGATTLGSLLKQGVVVDKYYCTSPAPRLDLPDGSRPWGGSTSSNVAMHTGTHLFESYNIDDIFLARSGRGSSPCSPADRTITRSSRTPIFSITAQTS